MVMLYGKQWTRKSLRARVGHESQLGGIQRMVLNDGNTRGVELMEFRTGSGLMFQVLPTRGMDIGLAEYQGRAVAWRSRTLEVEPGYLGDVGFEARRGSFGGLVCTCGYCQVGAPNEDNGVQYGLHGRAQLVPAQDVLAEAAWEGDEYRMWCQGKVRELDKFGEYFENTRRIETALGSDSIRITDSVRNLAFMPQAHMILYHINLGFPLVSGDTRLYAPSLSRRNRDRDSVDFDWTRYRAEPFAQPEDVLYHDMEADASGMVNLALVNETPGRERWGLKLSYSRDTLPRFVHWFQPSPGGYVMGLEPGNCWADGRTAHQLRDDLVIMQPDEVKRYTVEFTVLPGEAEVADALRGIRAA